MADNTTLNTGTGGDTIATDDIGGVKFQRVKIAIGADGVNDGDVSSANALPVSAASLPLPSGAATAAKQDTGNTSLASIDGKITAVNTGAVTISAALPAGTNAIGKLAANSGVDIGDVDVTSVIPGTGATNLGKAEDVGHSTGDTGVYALAVRDDALAAHSGTDGDYESLHTDKDGALWVNPSNVIVSEAVSDTGGTSSAFSNFGATASIKNYVTAISVFRTDAGTSPAYVDFRDGTAGSVLWRMPLPPNGGSVIASPKALFATSANTALAYDVSAALTTVYISVSGMRMA